MPSRRNRKQKQEQELVAKLTPTESEETPDEAQASRWLRLADTALKNNEKSDQPRVRDPLLPR